MHSTNLEKMISLHEVFKNHLNDILAATIFGFILEILIIPINNINNHIIFQIAISIWSLALLFLCLLTANAIHKFLPLPHVSLLKYQKLLPPVAICLALVSLGTNIINITTTPSNSYYKTDDSDTNLCAAQNFLQGKNPYSLNEAQCITLLHQKSTNITPLAAGPFKKYYPLSYPPENIIQQGIQLQLRNPKLQLTPYYGYPPLAFIWILPIANAPPQIVSLYLLLFLILIVGYIIYKEKNLWSIILIVFCLDFSLSPLMYDPYMGNALILALGCLVLASFNFHRPRFFAITLGIAIASSQLAWIFALGFLPLIILTKQDKSIRIKYLIATVLISFLPFLLLYHNSLPHMIALATMKSFPNGVGLSFLMVDGVILNLPKITFSLLFYTTLMAGTMLSFYYRQLAKIWPVLVIATVWFSWRDLIEYTYIILPMALGLIISFYKTDNPKPQEECDY